MSKFGNPGVYVLHVSECDFVLYGEVRLVTFCSVLSDKRPHALIILYRLASLRVMAERTLELCFERNRPPGGGRSTSVARIAYA